MFSPSRLRLARMRRQISKTALAAKSGIAVNSIANYEHGTTQPRPAAVDALADVLRFPVDFFCAGEIDILPPAGAHFRAPSKMLAAHRDAAIASARIAMLTSEWLDERFELPRVTVPDLDEHAPETAAAILRAEWGLGDRPVSSMIHLLESKGVRIFALPGDLQDVDAFSQWSTSCAYVFVNNTKSSERTRFDLAHELAHLAMHRRVVGTREREVEREADAFASAFLMPESAVRSVGRIPVDLPSLIALKRRWNVSLFALLVRLHRLGLLSEWLYRALCIQASTLGMRVTEPDPAPSESSQVLRKVIDALRDRGIRVADIAEQLRLPIEEVREPLRGLVPMRV
jgi:Zn-dependent peptidase ImmA (M78 family)/transcriptional regulator with XRE-family HTH domain